MRVEPSKLDFRANGEVDFGQPLGRVAPPFEHRGGGVCEVTGLEGRFSLSERVIQKLWLRREFSQTGLLADGRQLSLEFPGRWNLQAGPDFREARWSIDGRSYSGAVEIHVRQAEWFLHGHHEDPAYDDVRLHVVLYPPRPEECVARTLCGGTPDVLVLLPLLRCGLEELAEADALACLTGRDYLGLAEDWAGRPTEELLDLCRVQARARWQRKVGHAAERIRRFGWREACHGVALEVLGYHANRAAMASLAARWTLDALIRDKPERKQLLGYTGSAWSWRGVRPANRPDVRLAQYLAWIESAPDWPVRLLHWGKTLQATLSAERACQGSHALAGDGNVVQGPDAVRFAPPGLRARYLKRARECFSEEVCADSLSGTRLNNLAVDLALPFMAAQAEDKGAESAVEIAWMAWWTGDGPDELRTLIRAGCLATPGQPLSNGLIQGVLGALLQRRQSEIGAPIAEEA